MCHQITSATVNSWLSVHCAYMRHSRSTNTHLKEWQNNMTNATYTKWRLWSWWALSSIHSPMSCWYLLHVHLISNMKTFQWFVSCSDISTWRTLTLFRSSQTCLFIYACFSPGGDHCAHSAVPLVGDDIIYNITQHTYGSIDTCMCNISHAKSRRPSELTRLRLERDTQTRFNNRNEHSATPRCITTHAGGHNIKKNILSSSDNVPFVFPMRWWGGIHGMFRLLLLFGAPTASTNNDVYSADLLANSYSMGPRSPLPLGSHPFRGSLPTCIVYNEGLCSPDRVSIMSGLPALGPPPNPWPPSPRRSNVSDC